MIKQKEEELLKKLIDECFPETEGGLGVDAKLLGFSMLVKEIVKNMELILSKLRLSLEEKRVSKETKDRLDDLGRSLLYLKRFCGEKIEKKTKGKE
ncbi:MAG: hypothetical protein JW734_03940 [Candidatus Omnitrophica bacterium]|nr:hypothetical protein [Candidatus Omnitrophota bacterium]